MYFWAAISIGLLGSLHCAGMCGPLLLTINKGKGELKSELLHHIGRLATYALFGAIAGAIGQTFSFMGVQQWFSITIGAMMVLSVLMIPLSQSFKKLEALLGRISIRFSSWVHSKPFSTYKAKLLMGVANGLLPCGLVYLALAGAANTFTPWDGALFMVMFGLGTIPALALVLRLSDVLSLRVRNQIRKLIPIAVLLIGVLLIVRGMNLGVPYLSPQDNSQEEAVVNCR